MTDRQNAQLNMAQRVFDVLSEHNPLFAPIDPMQSAFNELNDTLENIRLAEQEQGQTTVSTATRDKADAETIMIDHALVVASCLYVIGINDHNNELLTQANLASSSFIHLEDNEKLALARRIANLAANYANELVAFGIYGDFPQLQAVSNKTKTSKSGSESTTLQALSNAIDNYKAIIAKPMDSLAVRKQKTTTLQYLFPQLKSTLADKLDKMMILFKQTAPEFYNQYKTARNIINTSVRHRKTDEEEQSSE